MTDDDGAGTWRELDHTADWTLRATGPTFAAMLRAAARGAYAMAGASVGDSSEPVAFEVEAGDDVGLLVGFLSELVYRLEVDRRVVVPDAIEETSSGLSVRGVGRQLEGLEKEIKAVTWHGAAVDSDGATVGRVTFDV